MVAKLILFDVDGTLVESGKKISNVVSNVMSKLHNDNILGVIGGGTYEKLMSQLDNSSKYFTYIFSECGSVVHKQHNEKFQEISKKNIVEYLGANTIEKIKEVYLNELEHNDYLVLNNIEQYKWYDDGKYVDIRNGLIYFTPVGMESNDKYRNIFINYNKKTDWNKYVIDVLNNIDNRVTCVLGGAVGIACYPTYWNKAQILPYIKSEGHSEIYFFGDKTQHDGNDYPMYNSKEVIGVSVISPDDTITKIKQLEL